MADGLEDSKRIDLETREVERGLLALFEGTGEKTAEEITEDELAQYVANMIRAVRVKKRCVKRFIKELRDLEADVNKEDTIFKQVNEREWTIWWKSNKGEEILIDYYKFRKGEAIERGLPANVAYEALFCKGDRIEPVYLSRNYKVIAKCNLPGSLPIENAPDKPQ